MTRPYRFLEHTGEVGAQAWGTDLAAVLGAAAQALFAVMADLRSVRVRRWAEVEVQSPNVESLLVEWLNDLLFRWETTRLLLRRFEVEATETRLRARCGGERYDPRRHRLKLDVKGATYHQARVDQSPRGCTARVVLDV